MSISQPNQPSFNPEESGIQLASEINKENLKRETI